MVIPGDLSASPPAASPVDALLVVSFGGPEGPADVLPFLRNVTRGRGIPDERLAEVGEHYQLFGGVSPINAQNRALVDAVRTELASAGLTDVAVYWGNRNWAPYLSDTLREMTDDGVRHALAFVTSCFSSYSGCRQYQEDIERARAEAGEGAPRVDRLRHYYNSPGFVEAMVDRVLAALADLDARARPSARLVFTAHSIPVSMARSSGPSGDGYTNQLREACGLVAERVGGDRTRGDRGWDLVFQSRSGAPGTPWLEPDVGDHLEVLHSSGVRSVVLVPIGFVSDHVEVLYDLDIEARDTAARLPGMTVVRAGTVGTHPRFVAMVRELVQERMSGTAQRPVAGSGPPSHDVCPRTCCPAPVRPVASSTAQPAVSAAPS